MRTDHRTPCTSKCVITDSNTSYNLSRISRNSSRREPTTTICCLTKSEACFSPTSHIFYVCIFTNSNTTALAGMVINIGSVTYCNITGCSTSTIRITNASSLPNCYVFYFRSATPRTNSNAKAITSRIRCRGG